MQSSPRLIGLAMLLFGALTGGAQTPAYLHYGVQEGLPSNLVYCGLQDRRGLLWFGTDKGLVCFDGTRFRTFTIKDGLPDPEVLNLMEDSKGRLWISNYLKQPCYRKNGRFMTVRQDSMLSKLEVRSALWEFYEDANQNIWLAGQAPTIVQLSDNQVESIPLPDGVVRLGEIDRTLFMFGVRQIFQQQATNQPRAVNHIGYSTQNDANPFMGLSLSGNHVLYSYIDKLMLFEWRDGLFHLKDTRVGLAGRVFTDRSGRFWVCSLADGAVCFDNVRRDLSNPKRYFKEEKVTAMFEDRQGTIWFCTTDNGIYALPKNTAINYTERNGLVSNNITALARGYNGQLWAGDDEGHLYEFDDDDDEGFNIVSFDSYDGYNRIRRILPTPDGGRWIVADEALYYEHGASRRKMGIHTSPKTGLLLPGKVWYAASGGLGYVAEGSFDLTYMLSGRYTALGSDSDGYVWAGSNEGLYCQRDSFQFDFGNLFSALKGRMVAIETAGKNAFWIATPENGLLLAKVQNGRMESVDIVNEHLKTPIENIQSLFAEPGGRRLWLATNKGVYGLDAEWNVVHFDRHDGLADDDVNAIAVYGDTLWAATVGGLSRILLRPPDADGDFPTLITSARYRLDDRMRIFHLLDSLSYDRRIVLPPNASLFEIELAGLDYRSRGNLHYECVTTTRLPYWRWWTLDNLLVWIGDGFVETSNITRVSASNLSFGVKMPPGCYHLSITAINAGDVCSLRPATLTVEMRPFWYNTIWFWLILWGIVFFALWRFLRARNAYRKLDQAVSDLQLRALQAQMNPHFVGNSINAIQQFFYPPDPVRASQYISLFTRLLRRTMLFSEQTFIPFQEELAYNRDYLEMVKLRFGDRFHFEITGAEAIPHDTPFPSMLLQPLLENATLHGLAPEGVSVLTLHFVMDRKKLICNVTDNGVGVRAARERQKATGKESKSKGLEMLQQKVATLNSRFNINLHLEVKDLSDAQPSARGTCANVQFIPGKIAF